MKRNLSILIAFLAIFNLLACTLPGGVNSNSATACYADKVTLNEAKIEDYKDSNIVFFTFDVKNNGKTATDNLRLNYKIIVKTTDGLSYETKSTFNIKLSPGATGSKLLDAKYGGGKAFQSYTIELYCE
jgi:hypothetical protein